MAENKQYITQQQDNGSVLISEDVIAEIVAHAACEVEGVVGINAKSSAEITELIGKKNRSKGLKITVQENNSIIIDCNITVNYGLNVIDIAKAAQASIINALDSMAAIQIEAVNVNVCSITRQ